MSHLGDSLRTYWCGPSGHDFTVARRRRDGTMSTVLCVACQKRRASSTCLFYDAEGGPRVTVISPESRRVVGIDFPRGRAARLPGLAHPCDRGDTISSSCPAAHRLQREPSTTGPNAVCGSAVWPAPTARV